MLAADARRPQQWPYLQDPSPHLKNVIRPQSIRHCTTAWGLHSWPWRDLNATQMHYSKPGMNKSQQMRWSRRGADLLLQVRCAVFNGTLGSGFGQLFQPHANQNERRVKAA
jgi:hypothetical protein